jgi:amino acid transporter
MTLDGASSSAGLTGLIATLAFVFPVLIWYRYSEQIASAGGLFAFVEAAVGRRIAAVQAAFWIVSYALYLVYTVPFIVYDLLPNVFAGIHQYLLLIDVVLALVIAVLMMAPLVLALSVLALIATLQVAVAVALAGAELLHLGLPAGSLVGHGNLGAILNGAARISTLYICASLPLFLGGEVRGGTRSVQRSLGWAFGFVGVLVVVALFPLAQAGSRVLSSEIPGAALAQVYGGAGFGVVAGLGVAASVAGLIIAEFLALTRVLAALFNRPIQLMVSIAVGAFVVGSLLSLLNPQDAYAVLLKPSLVALWISQLIVVAAYPWFVRKRRSIRAGDVGLASAASGLMLFGLYTAVTASTGT